MTSQVMRWSSMGQEEANYHSILQASSHLLSEMTVKRPRCQAENILPSSFTFFVCVLLAAVLAALKIPHSYSQGYSLLQCTQKSFH